MALATLIFATARSYHVSSTAGDDHANGTSAAPWRTFAPLAALKMVPGDDIVLRSGDVWESPLELHGTGGAGTTLPVTIGPDETAAPRPTIALHGNGVCVRLLDLGNGGAAGGEPTLQVRAIQDCRHGNVYVDTSSARSIVPGLVEWAVQEIGADRILFGSDTPVYSVAMQRARIDSAAISDEAKRMILRENARKLLGVT